MTLCLSLLIIEHDMRLVMEVSDRAVVLDHGERSRKGRPPRCSGTPR